MGIGAILKVAHCIFICFHSFTAFLQLRVFYNNYVDNTSWLFMVCFVKFVKLLLFDTEQIPGFI